MRGVVFVWGAVWAKEREGVMEVWESSGSFGTRWFIFARVRVVELNEVVLNPACEFDELGQCGGGPEVEKLGREEGKKLVAESGDSGTGVLITEKIDIELDPLGQECFNHVVGPHDKTFLGGQRSPELVQVPEAVVKQEEG